MKDVAYFLGSCLDDRSCEQDHPLYLDYYFQRLHNHLKDRPEKIDCESVEDNWRSLYPVAWTDFHRFLKGWTRRRWKHDSYSERIARKTINLLLDHATHEDIYLFGDDTQYDLQVYAEVAKIHGDRIKQIFIRQTDPGIDRRQSKIWDDLNANYERVIYYSEETDIEPIIRTIIN